MSHNKFDNSPAESESVHPTSSAISAGEIVLGTLVGVDCEGRPLVTYSKAPCAVPLVAISTIPVFQAQVGRSVALLFASGDMCKPVIMGLIHSPLEAVLESTVAMAGSTKKSTTDNEPSQENIQNATNTVSVDGERVLIEGEKEIVLKCGEASITLTRAGKILIRGRYLLNRSTGVNRIMGGSVQVN